MAILLLFGTPSHKANRAYYVTCCREGCEARLLFSSRWSWIRLEHSFMGQLGKTRIVWLLALWSQWALSPFSSCGNLSAVYFFEASCPKAQDISPWLVDWEVRSVSFLFLPDYPFCSPSRSIFSLLWEYRTRVHSINCFVEFAQRFYQFPSLQGWDTGCCTKCAAWCLASHMKRGEAHFCSAGINLCCNIVQGWGSSDLFLLFSCLDLFVAIDLSPLCWKFEILSQPSNHDHLMRLMALGNAFNKARKLALKSPIIWDSECFSSISFYSPFPAPALSTWDAGLITWLNHGLASSPSMTAAVWSQRIVLSWKFAAIKCSGHWETRSLKLSGVVKKRFEVGDWLYGSEGRGERWHGVDEWSGETLG